MLFFAVIFPFCQHVVIGKSILSHLFDTSNHFNVNHVKINCDAVFIGAEEMLIMQAMKHWEDHTCVRFNLRVSEENYIHFLAGKLGLEFTHSLIQNTRN